MVKTEKKDSTIYNQLSTIQKDLKAPKGQLNKFGNYKYRNCEDILEALKPLLPVGTSIILSDEIIQIGDRFYVKATATLTNGEDAISNSAFAREAQIKKGMDESQITGATSSYARKYALNGLLAIDDTKDADSDDNSEKPATKPATVPAKMTTHQSEMIQKLIKDKGKTGNDLRDYAKKAFDLDNWSLMSMTQASQTIAKLSKLPTPGEDNLDLDEIDKGMQEQENGKENPKGGDINGN